MSYKDTIKLIRCIRDQEYVAVRNIIDKWPQSSFEELLNLIYCVVKSTNDEDFDDDVSFNKEESKALMMSACESKALDDLWNYGLNDEVPIHFDNYKAFLCACKNGNLRMIKDFRRFQYDHEDGHNMIPDSVWLEGIKLAKSSSNKETAEWIAKYLQDGTDDEDDDFEESGDDEAMECAGEGCTDECCECKDEAHEIEDYNRIHSRMVSERQKRRADDAELISRIKNL